ncbi:MAG: sigma-70 family RNA polymerase sigma factor, partial [Gemmataceae bacterium]
MASQQLRTFIQHLRRCVCPRGDDTLSDAQLLERWDKQRDEAAFEVLLWRHGAMVLSVCRRLLRDSHDIEDAFQATFLTLVRKGTSIRRPEALAAWLYRVAYRIALRMRDETAERARREQSGVEMLTGAEADEPTARDLRAVVDEEIDALPERYRQAFVLCCLEGKTHAEAARLLDRPTGTVSCWLKRGRERLRERLTQRGFAPAALVAVGESEAQAALPAALVRATGRAATVFAAGGEGGAAMISARVAAIVDVAVKGMGATKLQWTLVLGLMLSMAATGAGMWAYQSPTQPPSTKQQAKAETAETPRAQHEPAARKDRYGDPLPEGTIARLGTVRLRAVGAAIAISKDGKSIITLSGGRQLKWWDAGTGQPRQRRELPIQLSQFFLSNDGRLLAGKAQGFDSPIDIWDVVTGKRLHQLRLPRRTGIYRASFSPEGKTFAASGRAGVKAVVRLWDVASGELRELTGHASPPESLAFSPDGQFLAASDGRSVICWDVARGEKLWQRKCAFGVTLAFTPDGRTLIGSPGHQEQAWHAWKVATGTRASGLKLPEGYNYAH